MKENTFGALTFDTVKILAIYRALEKNLLWTSQFNTNKPILLGYNDILKVKPTLWGYNDILKVPY